MARDLDDAAAAGRRRRAQVSRADVRRRPRLRDLPLAYVVDPQAHVKVAVLEDKRIPYVAPPAHLIQVAEDGHVPLLMPSSQEGSTPSSLRGAARPAGPRCPARARGGDHQAAQLSGLLSLRGARRRAGSVVQHLRDTGSRRPPTSSCGARRGGLAARARPHVLHDLADGAACRHLGRAVVRRPVRGAHPAPDQCGPGGDARQSHGAAADPPRRRRPAPTVDQFQRHDPGAGEPAHRARHGQQPAHRAPPVHGSRAVGRVRRRDRPRPQTAASRLPAARPQRLLGRNERGDSSGTHARRSRAGVRGLLVGDAPSPAPEAAAQHQVDAHHRRRRAQLLRACHASEAPGEERPRLGADLRRRHRAGRRRSARPPGPTWRGASPTRSRTR